MSPSGDATYAMPWTPNQVDARFELVVRGAPARFDLSLKRRAEGGSPGRGMRSPATRTPS
jgi:hypothetical protein